MPVRSFVQIYNDMKHILLACTTVKLQLACITVQSCSLILDSVGDIQWAHRLTPSMFSVDYGVTDNIFKENLESTTSLLINKTADALHPTTARQAADGRLGDSLDVVTEYFPVALGPPLSNSLSTFSSSGHVSLVLCTRICW